MNSDEKIFIAGSTGMVGSSIKKTLIKKFYGSNNFEGKLLESNRNELNLLNFSDVMSWFSFNRPDIVIIAAAKVGGINANNKEPYEFIYENLAIQTNLIEASKQHGVKKLLFLGSSCIYPKMSKQPIKEEYLLTGELEPTNEGYALAKICAARLCKWLLN